MPRSAGAGAKLDTGPQRPVATPRHAGLDLLRALAIILTCLMHFVWVIGAWRYERDFELLSISAARTVDEGVWLWLYHSQHGVYLFFVLSGYLMTRRWFAQSPPSLRRYLTDRALRTLPGAWLAISAMLMLLAFAGNMPADAPLRWLENAFFLNWFRADDTRHLLIVTWSLQAEWIFYLLLPLIWFGAQRSAPSAALPVVIMTGLAAIAVLKLTSLRGAAYALFFMTGSICALKQEDWRAMTRAIPWSLVLASYCLINVVYAWTTPTAARLQPPGLSAFDAHAVTFAIVSGALLLKVADHTFANSARVRAGLHVGRISYSIYLWNLLVVLALGQFLNLPARLNALPGVLAIAVYLSICCALTWAISRLSFAIVEQPYFTRRSAHTKIV